jgi:hypothetical protein
MSLIHGELKSPAENPEGLKIKNRKDEESFPTMLALHARKRPVTG